MSRLFDTHVVNQGETAYSISRRYGISLQTLIEDNPGFDPAHLSIGQKINIRIKSQGQTHPEQIKEEIAQYTEKLNSVSTHFTHHAVKQGETLYSLSHSLNIPVDTLVKYNAEELKDGLKMGSILRIPVKDTVVTTQAVGETLPPETEAPGPWNQLTVDGTQDVNAMEPMGSSTGSFPLQTDRSDGSVACIGFAAVAGGIFQQSAIFGILPGLFAGFGELKGIGVSAQVDVFNTGRSEAEVEAVLRDPALRQADLIVGPVYDECFARQLGLPNRTVFRLSLRWGRSKILNLRQLFRFSGRFGQKRKTAGRALRR